MLLVKPILTLHKSFPFLNSSMDIGFDTLDLAFNLSLDVIKITRDGVSVVAFLLPLCLLKNSLTSLIFRETSQIFSLKSKFSSSVIGLTNVLRKLKDTLALTLITSSSIGKAIAERFHLFFDGANGGLVILLVPFQAISLILQLLISCGN